MLFRSETPHFSKKELISGARLACQVKVKQDMEIEIPEEVFGIKKWEGKVVRNYNVASFIKEAGVEVNRPDNNQPDDPEDSTSIVVEIASDNQIWMENRRVDIRAVRANIQRLLAEDPEAPVTVKVEKGAEAGIVVDVADAARESGVGAVNWASDR